jgi:prevent-host-death family protein
MLSVKSAAGTLGLWDGRRAGQRVLVTGSARLDFYRFGGDSLQGEASPQRATMTHMERIGVRHLQQNAAATLRRVRRGERVEVTDRGRPVALLVPIAGGDVLEALEVAGRLIRAEGDLLDAGPPVRSPRGAEKPSRRLARLRADER